jgi:hypothetical protein
LEGRGRGETGFSARVVAGQDKLHRGKTKCTDGLSPSGTSTPSPFVLITASGPPSIMGWQRHKAMMQMVM